MPLEAYLMYMKDNFVFPPNQSIWIYNNNNNNNNNNKVTGNIFKYLLYANTLKSNKSANFVYYYIWRTEIQGCCLSPAESDTWRYDSDSVWPFPGSTFCLHRHVLSKFSW